MSGVAKVFTNHKDEIYNAYLRSIKTYNGLSVEEEYRCGVSKQKKDRDKLIVYNLLFVVSIAKEYSVCAPLMDIIQDGNIGLHEAAYRFDATKGIRFTSYAVHWIRQSIINGLNKTARQIRLPENRLELYSKITRIESEFEKEFSRMPELCEIKERLDVTTDELIAYYNYKQPLLHIDNKCNDEEDSVYISELLPSDIAPTDQPIIDLSKKEELYRALKYELSEREVFILTKYFGLNGEPFTCTDSDIAQSLCVSEDYVRHLRNDALHKLKTNRKIKQFLAEHVL